MKKFIVAAFLAFLAPSFAVAAEIGCAVGGIVGGAIGSQIGGGNVPKILTVIGALGGCSAGSKIENGTYGQPVDVVVIRQPGGYAPQYGYGGAVFCDTDPGQGMYRLPPGKCRDPQSGGVVPYWELERRAQQTYQTRPQRYYAEPQRPARVLSYPDDMWENKSKSGNKQHRAEAPAVDGPTVDSYLSSKWSQVIPRECRTGNYGHDSRCLYEQAKILDQKQEACENDGRKCNPDLNYGKMAKIDRRLAADLRRAQDD